MSEQSTSASRARRRRADADRSRTAILNAAAQVLGEQPDASLEDIAKAAALTRQTVYAHYASREELISAVIDHVTEEVVAAMDAIGIPDDQPAEGALVRLLDASWRAADRYPLLRRAQPARPQKAHDLHRPIFDRLSRVIRRGQHTGEFGSQLPLHWLLAAIVALAHAAAEEVAAQRMTAEDARAVLSDSALRILRPT
ncbi:TetR/AcrR family transcriptional regulator [Actinomadura sp. 3N407]|uniref:TetR/AcrR family transcriptional regulator n=1 Tax=Actinomadura sp. 3N407 TaxID=3457423 RepID=UPI003FCE8057